MDAILFQPQTESRLRKTFWQTRGLEHDPEQGEPHAVPGAGPERSRRGVQSVASSPESRDLLQ